MNRRLEKLLQKPPSRLSEDDWITLRFNPYFRYNYNLKFVPKVNKKSDYLPIPCLTVRDTANRVRPTVAGG